MKILTKIWMPADSMKGVGKDDYNFGDRLGTWILEKMGHEPVIYEDAVKDETVGDYDGILHPVGSVIGNWEELDRAGLIRHFWGCGYSGRKVFDPEKMTNYRIHSVRGGITRSFLKTIIPYPIGDTGLLVSRFLDIEKTEDAGVVWASHLQSNESVTEGFLDDLMVDNTIDLLIKKDGVEAVCQQIKNARILISSALHPIIVAQSLGIPWAFAWPPGVMPQYPIKYLDFCSSIGIPFLPVRTLDEAEKFWARYGSKTVNPDLDAMLAAFPYANE